MHEMFRDVAVIPVLTIARAADAVPLAEALLRGGLRVIEVTLRTPAAAEAIAEIRRRVPDVVVGAGTLLKGADIGRAVAAGARFLVSPGLTPELAAAGLASERPYLPGVVTPSEVMAARDLGLSLLKFFPATGAGGVDTLATYAPVFPGVAFCATGGVDRANAGAYLALANVTMVGGDWMAPADAVAAGDWRKIEALAREAAALRRK
ncbi:MAG TPA: bifunctional 4-hydroxy-2-oxoglutarate aldolase/2-dehydro-3-deoxy-phosphogluconate aldolase [Stellaceae bacterium]|jgi:2-dehydro-3-deoxyphosphogluconate aldolase/(4S)-4-hydroxy-2-oxoglutarate aldolase|nr:bifunctional 4-hydroxy-2-oxoglutarate aldolase/2-dehydro-3-deoxy-phosphogluconate aldolase [Stellaceae bacterium]